MGWVWIILIVFVVILDIGTSNILFSWLSIGFMAAAVLDLFKIEFGIQVLVAGILGVIFIIIGNIVSRKYIKNNIQNKPVLIDKIIGNSFIAEKDIEKLSQQKVNGIYWFLINQGETIKKSEKFIVTKIEKNKLVIKKGEN